MPVTRHAPAFLGVLLVCATLAIAAPPPASAPAPAGTAHLDIQELRLDNGLRIFVLERTASPTFAGLYQFGVGGATDPKGKSGIAHLLEHMMFKGSRSIGTLDVDRESPLLERISQLWKELHAELDKQDDPFHPPDANKVERLQKEIEQLSGQEKDLIVKNEYDELITRAGGVSMNASTNFDVTRYFVQLPANALEFWFRVESERLMHPFFREFYSERDVVYEERRLRTENTPGGRSFEALLNLMFTAHPYGTPVVGWPRDLQRLVMEDALDYFTTYYSPSNCVMVLVGDVRKDEVERLARKYFGSWKRQEIPRLPLTAEPDQLGERRRVVGFESEPRLLIGWPTVVEGAADQYALDVLAAILGGLSSSRIGDTIVQKERIAATAGAGHSSGKYAGWFTVTGVVRGDHSAAELEAALDREIARIQTDGVTAQELERARTAVEVQRVSGFKSNLGQAQRIATAVFTAGSPDYLEQYPARINAVTPEQVQAVAKNYLRPERKNVVEVRKLPGAGGGSGRGGAAVDQHGGAVGPRGQKHSKAFEETMTVVHGARPVELKMPEIGKDVQRVKLDGGITVFIKEDHAAPSVEIGFRWLGGSNTTPVDQLAPYELASDLLDEGGTEALSPTDLERRKDELGMSFSVGFGEETSRAGFWSLKRNLEPSFDLALDILMRPRFDAERLETLKGQYVEAMRRRTENPGVGANVLLDHVIYRDHPRLGYVPTRQQIEAVSPEQIRAVWRRHLGRDNLYMTVVGDFNRDQMLRLLQTKLGRWRTAEEKKRQFMAHDPLIRPGVYVVEKELPQPAVRVFHEIPVDRTLPLHDHAALEILNDILGGSGFRSRLTERLRSDEGLTYGIGSGLEHEGRPGVPGFLRIAYQTRQDSVARSIASVLDEYQKIIREQVNAPEVEEQIEAWRNRFIFRYTNDFSIVSRLMDNELDDRPYDFDRQELEAVQHVTVQDVQRVARKYFKPEDLTVVVFGKLNEPDRKALADRFVVKVLPREQVFTGGYEVDATKAKSAAPTAGTR